MNIIFFALGLFASIKFIHIFQLNGYKVAEQKKWHQKNMFKTFLFLLPLKPQKAKKPLVYTARVKRLLITTAILLSFTNWLGFLLTPILVIFASIVNQPIEKAVQNYYIKDAKKILNNMKALKVVGITGSYGKTSVKFYLNTLLKAQYNSIATPESFNTPMGVVRTIREKMRATDEVFVCEMGARNVGDIKEICDIVHPQIGIITSLGEQHLETFKNLKNIVKTKYELLKALPKDGIGFVNGDNVIIRDNMPKRKVITYGLNKNNDYVAKNIKTSLKGTSFEVNGIEFQTYLIGEHNVVNILGAIAVCHNMGISLEKLKAFVKKIEPVPHRLELKKHSNVTIIDDAYNSNPAGCKAALETLKMFDDYKILITPGMVELGTKEYEENFEFGKLATKACDYIILVGEQQTKPIYEGITKAKYKNVYVAQNLNEALNYAYQIKTEKRKIILLENDLPDNY
ncbi:MAG: UDP-N-acetylmuramoyl-tripeptide--D-alanyl-D-alanine ligase [Alphaproteobacteria bacterium]